MRRLLAPTCAIVLIDAVLYAALTPLAFNASLVPGTVLFHLSLAVMCFLALVLLRRVA